MSRKCSSLFVLSACVFLFFSCKQQNREKQFDGSVILELFYQKQNVEVIQEIVDKFEMENPNIKIEITSSTSDAGKQIFQTRMATNDPMDLTQHWASQAEFRLMCEEGRVLDLSGYAWKQNIIDTYTEASSVNGKLFSVPLAINAGVMAYNKTLFEKYNVNVPTTWNELIRICEVFKAEGIIPVIMSNGDKEGCSQRFHVMTAAVSDDKWNPYDYFVGMYQGSGKMIAQDGGYTRKATERLYELSSKYGVPDGFSVNYDISMQLFATEQGAMLMGGTWVQSDIVKNNPGLDFGMFAIPNDTQVDYLIGGIDCSIAAMTGTGNEDAAASFLGFLTRQDNAQIYTNHDKSPSPIKGVSTDNPTIELVLSYISQGKVIPWWRDFISTGVVSDEADIVQEFLMDGNVDKFLAAEEEIILRHN